MAPRSKDQKTAESINELREGDYLAPDLSQVQNPTPDSTTEPVSPPEPPLIPDSTTEPEHTPASTEDPDYIDVVVTGATLNHNGVVYPPSRTVKLPRKTADRLVSIGLVKPLSVLRQELATQNKAGLSITTDAEGVEIITGG